MLMCHFDLCDARFNIDVTKCLPRYVPPFM